MRQYQFIGVLVSLLPVAVLSNANVILPIPEATMAHLGLPAEVIPVVLDSSVGVVQVASSSEGRAPATFSGKYLNLNDAILLALRNNPDVLSAQLARVMDKYNVEIASYTFQPQYTLDINQTYQNNHQPIYDVTPTAKLETTMGTAFSVTNRNDMSGNQTTSLNVTQPLVKGFGTVAEVPYLNAMDNEKIAKLNYQSSITSVVMAVVSDYRSLVSSELNLVIDKKNLEATEKATQDDGLRYKAGKLAKSELVQQQATLASAKLSYQSQLNSVQTTYQNFLSQLGVSPWSKFSVNKTVSVSAVNLPSMEVCIQQALKKNLDYQKDLIALEQKKRAILTAKNDMKWSVNAEVNQELDVTQGTTGAPLSIDDVSASDPQFSLNVSVPIDHLQDQSALVSAKIDYEEAKAQLEQSKRDLMIQVQKEYQAITYDQQQIPIGEQSVELQKMSLDNVQLKFKYGKATALDVSTIQTSYVESQSSLVSYRISLLN